MSLGEPCDISIGRVLVSDAYAEGLLHPEGWTKFGDEGGRRGKCVSMMSFAIRRCKLYIKAEPSR